MLQATASLVVYETPAAELLQLFHSLQTAVQDWVLVDNSAGQRGEAEALERAVLSCGGQYLAAPRNLGFGAGHNSGLKLLRDKGLTQSYHLIVNPDITFNPADLRKLAAVFEARSDVGWIMPQVRSEDGVVQPMCKLLPTPMDLLGRRFLPRVFWKVLQLDRSRYELREVLHTPSDSVPFLSGCFVFARTTLLEKTGGFDPRYFLYMEDVDLCRRALRHAKLLYWPEVSVVHGHHRGSYHNVRLMFFHVRSAVRYFSRWGWFSDPERDAMNDRARRAIPGRHGERCRATPDCAERGDETPSETRPVDTLSQP